MGMPPRWVLQKRPCYQSKLPSASDTSESSGLLFSPSLENHMVKRARFPGPGRDGALQTFGLDKLNFKTNTHVIAVPRNTVI